MSTTNTTTQLLKNIINELEPSALLALVSKDGLMLEHVVDSKLTKELITAAVKNTYMAMEYIGKFNEDEEFMIQLLEIYFILGHALYFMSFAGTKLKSNRKFCMACIAVNGSNIKSSTCIDEELALLAVSTISGHLSYIPIEYRTPEVCCEACSHNYDSLKFVPDTILENKDILRKLIVEDVNIVSYLPNISLVRFSPNIREDIAFIEKILLANTHLARYFTTFLESKRLVLKLVSKDINILKLCGSLLRDDEEIILASIGNNSIAFASYRLRSDKDAMSRYFGRVGQSVIYGYFDKIGSSLKKNVLFLARLVEAKIISPEKLASLIESRLD